MYHILSRKTKALPISKQDEQAQPAPPLTQVPGPSTSLLSTNSYRQLHVWETPPVSDRKSVQREAREYLSLFYQEEGSPYPYKKRLKSIREDIERDGTYQQTSEELAYGARVAWRNHTRCIGRLHWKSLIVRDMRHLSTAAEVFAALIDHIETATHEGKIRSMITIFAPQFAEKQSIRIWNAQLIRYAGHQQERGAIIGDPSQALFTTLCKQLGWSSSQEGLFDLLPLVIQMPGQAPELFKLPGDSVLEVPLHHPDFLWFDELGLKWHALPAVSNMRLNIGGITYPCAPFSGWYMATEVARNLSDPDRYNQLPLIAERLGLNTHSERSLWRDQALIELNRAILHSFHNAGVSIVDHHTASRQFILHEQCEAQAGRQTHGDWGWLVPPISGALSPIFHRSYEDRQLLPNFCAQPAPWENSPPAREQVACPAHAPG